MSTYKSYISGFVFSLLLTLSAYILVTERLIANSGSLTVAVLCLAVLQLIIQLKFFLHLNFKEEGRWNVAFLVSAVSIVLLVVIGSLWIMSHLNYNMMPSQKFMIMDENMHMK